MPRNLWEVMLSKDLTKMSQRRYDRLVERYTPIVVPDAKYLAPLKSWQYGTSRARRSLRLQDRDWRSMDEIRQAYPTRNIQGRGVPLSSQPTARDKVTLLHLSCE